MLGVWKAVLMMWGPRDGERRAHLVSRDVAIVWR
jgi:hypothetical protein